LFFFRAATFAVFICVGAKVTLLLFSHGFQADLNADGVIEWKEMLTVVEPLLGKYWKASLAGAPEYSQWTELHWETHHTVEKTKDG
jgi:hypothetical protein